VGSLSVILMQARKVEDIVRNGHGFVIAGLSPDRK
jgi:hypothetical protein